MKNYITKPVKNVVIFTVAAVVFVTSFAIPILAQQQGNPVYVPPAMERREADMANQRETRQREMMRESLGRVPERRRDPRYVQAVIAQINQDFERIQLVRNQIVRFQSASDGPDYKFISDAAAEVKKRANRLKSNLALADTEEDEKVEKIPGELNGEQVRTALSTLCDRIESFVKSPVFETPGVIDVQVIAKTSRDLRSMIELGDSISKSAERLSKTPQKF